MTEFYGLVVEGNLRGLILTVGEACSTIVIAVRDCGCLIPLPKAATGLPNGCSELTAGFPTGIRSILPTPELRPGNESRKTLHARRIRGDSPSLSAGRTRPSVVPQMRLSQNRRSATSLTKRPGCISSPHQDSGPRRSLCLTAPDLYPKMEGRRFRFSLGPESGQRKFVCYDTGPPWPRRPFGLLAEDRKARAKATLQTQAQS